MLKKLRLMNKILVTTDLSPYSTAGIRFAITLARQTKSRLTFFHVYKIEKPVSWSEKKFSTYALEQKLENSEKLEAVVMSIVKPLGMKKGAFHFDVMAADDASQAILNHARRNHFDFICVSRRGAGILKKMFGTHTSWLINNSSVPLLVAPQKYRSTPIKTLMYASDLKDLKNELTVLTKFNTPLAAEITLIHVGKDSEAPSALIDDVGLKLLLKNKIKLLIENRTSASLISSIRKVVDFSPPSLFVIFSRPNKSIVSKVMNPGLSSEFSFDTAVPMLVFNKGRSKRL